MTKSKTSAQSIVAPSMVVMHLIKGAQFLNADLILLSPTIYYLQNCILVKCKHHFNQED